MKTELEFLKTLNDYIDLVNETFNSPQPIEWINKENNLFGFFEVENNHYRIECMKQIGNNYSYAFSIYKDGKYDYHLTKLGLSGLKVLSTVIAGMEYLYDTYQPNAIIFSAIDDSESRKSLYERYCERFCNKHDYKFSNRGALDKIIFVLYKNNLSALSREEIFAAVKKMIEEGK